MKGNFCEVFGVGIFSVLLSFGVLLAGLFFISGIWVSGLFQLGPLEILLRPVRALERALRQRRRRDRFDADLDKIEPL